MNRPTRLYRLTRGEPRDRIVPGKDQLNRAQFQV